MRRPDLGEKFYFTPAAFVGEFNNPARSGRRDVPRSVTGRVVYINDNHRYFDVEYEVNGVKLREAFKFEH